MIKTENGLSLFPSDLINHLGCGHLTQLNLAVAEGRLEKPKYHDPNADVLRERGLEFEKAYLYFLQKDGSHITVPSEENTEKGFERTLSDMQKGVDFIYQARLEMDEWGGIADFLKRIERPSSLGNWSYEVIDTKLARETKAGAILQLCLYSQVIERIQGFLPEHIHVVTPGVSKFESTSFRTEDYLAYHRLMQRRLQDQLADNPDLYPETVLHCDICRWWQVCDKRRRTDDHLSLVAGISNMQMAELRGWGINTLEGLAELPLPINRKPSRGAVESFESIREQARIQLEGRVKQSPTYELLDLQIGCGLYNLPEPSPGDIFLDFEGDPFVGQTGLEYLTGWITVNSGNPDYHHIWAFGASEEKSAFEKFMDFVTTSLELYPDLHIYHFGHYEPSALKRLMGRYVTRENEIDNLLRGQRFIDLHRILKHTLRASVEKYSLKDLEVFFKFNRDTDLRIAAQQKRNLEHALELSNRSEISEESKATTMAYNREDCLSAHALRNWLEKLREEQINSGYEIPRPPLLTGKASESLEATTTEVKIIFDRLMEGIPLDPGERTPAEHAKWLLANMLDWHRREQKAKWWEYFRLRDLSDDEIMEERAALGKLHIEERLSDELKYVIDQYSFPLQDSDLFEGDQLEDLAGERLGSIINIDLENGIIDIRKNAKHRTYHPTSVFTNKVIDDKVKRLAILRIGQWVAENDIDADGVFSAGRGLLMRKSPIPERNDLPKTESLLEEAKAWSTNLQNGILPIQGPPGAGKTFTGARIITNLVKEGKKVGITALSHKVMRNLLDEVVRAANEEGIAVKCAHKLSKKSSEPNPQILEITDNAKAETLLRKSEINVLAGTSWLWPRQEFYDSVDVLIVDEAGQLSLVDALAASQAAKSLILLGDPQQLKQPQQGSHPDGTEVSALEHLLQGESTIADDKGLFLGDTWRLHPKICDYISELFYAGKLHPHEGMEKQLLDGNTKFQGAGLWYVPVDHQGNQNSSVEEAAIIQTLFQDLIQGDVFWTNYEGIRRAIGIEDVLVIAPYNAQVARIKSILPDNARVGTVDKFQGQEAPVVIYSMSTSSPEDAPRGMDFLYNANRFNVAISRARCTVLLVASPKLFHPDCRTPAQMKMANAFCRYIEMAKFIE